MVPKAYCTKQDILRRSPSYAAYYLLAHFNTAVTCKSINASGREDMLVSRKAVRISLLDRLWILHIYKNSRVLSGWISLCLNIFITQRSWLLLIVSPFAIDGPTKGRTGRSSFPKLRRLEPRRLFVCKTPQQIIRVNVSQLSNVKVNIRFISSMVPRRINFA